MEFDQGDAFRRGKPPAGDEGARSAGTGSSATGSAPLEGESLSAWSGASDEQVDAALRVAYREAARAALDADVHPVDLSAYENAAGGAAAWGGTAAVGAAGAGDGGAGGSLPPGAGPAALADLRDLWPVPARLAAGSCQLGSDGLDEGARLLIDLGEQVETAQVFLLADAIGRGQVIESDSGSPRQWLTDRAARMEPGQASRIATAAAIITEPQNACLRSALGAGEVSTRAVVVAVREVPRAQAALPDASRDELLGYYLAVGHHYSSKHLRELTRRIIEAFGGDQGTKDEERLSKLESLRWSELASGLTRLEGELSPANAAILKAAVEALAAPSTGKDPESGEPVPDLRTPAKRRADALMALVQAGLRVGDGEAPGTVATKCTVTIPLSVLIGAVVATAPPTTALGDVLDAGTARELACDAQLVPVVLGTTSQPLDVGRAARPFNAATRAAVAHRDSGGCTFPGCDRPVPWCEVHHAVPWWVNGRSELPNGTLLCSRHHHIVHNKGYLPWITGSEVIWDLIPGRMPTTPLPPDDPLTHGPGAPPGYPATG